MSSLTIKLGAFAREHIAREGLRPGDIRCIPAAAGGPKGLALMPLDRWLFGEWLHEAKDLTLVGASIGAWRMAAAVQRDPVRALANLQRAYIEDQNYRIKPSPAEVTQLMRGNLQANIADWQAREHIAFRALTARAVGRLSATAARGAFARAAFANTRGRHHLAQHLQRVIFAHGPASPLDAALESIDAFGAIRVPLTAQNRTDALMASGTLPMICDPVKDIAGAPAGWYWDGGLIDYHLHYPYARMAGLTLYPHFTPSVTPGWLDKFLPWRKQGVKGRGGPWLSNLILIAPSPEFLARLPNGKLPDRNDFYRYEGNHPARITAWNRAMAECQRFAEEAARWLMKPDLSMVGSL
ncbi:MAG TPA: patatin-like phospholipase family protein [Burkholderiales bacterium]